MSLGQLTADYADSDEEQLNDSLEDKKPSEKLGSRLSSSSSAIKKSPPHVEANEIKTKKEEQDLSLSKSLDATNISFTELSGVIEDDDDDPPPISSKSSPVNPRVDERKTGDSNKNSPASNAGSGSSSKNTPVKKLNRLVSYANEEDEGSSEDSDTEDDEVLHSEPMDTGTDDDNSQQGGPQSGGDSRSASRPGSPSGGVSVSSSGVVIIDGIKLPPAPVGKKCSQALQDKISKALAGVMRGDTDYNYSIQHKKEFRNPSIYEKLVEHLRLDENGTNYPVSLYDPHCWGKESFYEELARVQKEEMEKREKERKERTKVDFVAGTKKTTAGVEEETKKRKSRFDSGRPDSATSSVAKPVGLVSTLPAPVHPKTSIDAFGSLNKKIKS